MIKVLVVDDSAVVRKILTETLEQNDDIKVVGSAPDPYRARDMILELKPDVLTLDIEMPKMDGLTFLSKLMVHFPMPVIIVSSLTRSSVEMSVKAMELGAVDVVSKPGSSFSVGDLKDILADKIRAAGRAVVRKRKVAKNVSVRQVTGVNIETTSKLVAIGASTGGTEAIKEVLVRLPANFPGILIAQHMPPGFTRSLAERLNQECAMEVREARNGDQVAFGRVLIAPGNYHMLLRRSGAKYIVRLTQGQRVHFQRPSVDVMFKSVAMNAGRNAIGVILTGMGADGAEGLMMMKKTGAYTIGQDERSSVVYGMPKKAYDIGAVSKQCSLEKIPELLVNILNRQDYHF
ncbi:MAG: protein-glutamate methylesterase/protein-glutamine glutaminase [Candidatus Muiribacteriaceae bacterium]